VLNLLRLRYSAVRRRERRDPLHNDVLRCFTVDDHRFTADFAKATSLIAGDCRRIEREHSEPERVESELLERVRTQELYRFGSEPTPSVLRSEDADREPAGGRERIDLVQPNYADASAAELDDPSIWIGSQSLVPALRVSQRERAWRLNGRADHAAEFGIPSSGRSVTPVFRLRWPQDDAIAIQSRRARVLVRNHHPGRSSVAGTTGTSQRLGLKEYRTCTCTDSVTSFGNSGVTCDEP
jgi:hypothetical protein